MFIIVNNITIQPSKVNATHIECPIPAGTGADHSISISSGGAECAKTVSSSWSYLNYTLKFIK